MNIGDKIPDILSINQNGRKIEEVEDFTFADGRQ